MIKGQLRKPPTQSLVVTYLVFSAFILFFIIISSIIINNTKSILALLISSQSFKDFVMFLANTTNLTGNTIREFLLVISIMFIPFWLVIWISVGYGYLSLASDNVFINLYNDHIEFKRGIFSSVKNYKLDEIEYIRPKKDETLYLQL
ncbi:hypothetical protein KQ875_01155 [Mycoplasma zalophi]|uniref:Uncharacterized protein n=1 Tax=Mycoplasma zalophi TaxID=191287 RepID=A0ABS6DQJ9_9MOLU|nr:hypothetical protein [Mycoplasma zalophi]MBU4692202.1 hypothetical protein [Mycoplasma zalophi]